jgi:hypothetical protein
MLGLVFQDDAQDLDAGVSAFIRELGHSADGTGRSGESRLHRRHPAARRHPGQERHYSGRGSAQGFSDSRKARKGKVGTERAAIAALKQAQSWVASLACSFGFEIADTNTVSTVN